MLTHFDSFWKSACSSCRRLEDKYSVFSDTIFTSFESILLILLFLREGCQRSVDRRQEDGAGHTHAQHDRMKARHMHIHRHKHAAHAHAHLHLKLRAT